jgi:hypothetical protein
MYMGLQSLSGLHPHTTAVTTAQSWVFHGWQAKVTQTKLQTQRTGKLKFAAAIMHPDADAGHRFKLGLFRYLTGTVLDVTDVITLIMQRYCSFNL